MLAVFTSYNVILGVHHGGKNKQNKNEDQLVGEHMMFLTEVSSGKALFVAA